MALSQDEIKTLDEAIKEYSFPCDCYEFPKDQPINFPNMREVEEFIRKDLKSGNRAYVKNGLSNVLYWGFAQVGYRDKRVGIFRSQVTQGQLYDATNLFKEIRGNALKEIWRIKLPQFSGMSFISKVRMFLDPTTYVVLDQQILKMNKAPFGTLLNNIKFGDKETQIRISNDNTAVYQQWCDKCNEISNTISNGIYRAVDIERGFFTLIQNGEVLLAAEILSKA
jgi:hypothetical protein